MSLTPIEITHIAKLARLRMEDQQARSCATQLSRVLELIEQMNQIDTSGIEPMSHPQDTALILREDRVTASAQTQAYLEIAPAVENGLYLVPRVIE